MKTTLKLAGVAFLVAAVATLALTRGPVAANTGDPLILGSNNTAGAETGLNSDAIYGLTVTAQNTGIRGQGAYAGVDGFGNTNGVLGVTQSASATGNGVWGQNGGPGNGVFGLVSNSGASGVYGQNNGTGYGVAGRAHGGTGVLGDSANGTGVWANSDSAVALRVSGVATFSRSGIAVVPANATSIVVTGVKLSAYSFVLASLQNTNGNVALKAAVPVPVYGAIQLVLTAAPTAAVKVGWLVLN
jgi:hypothetical protein